MPVMNAETNKALSRLRDILLSEDQKRLAELEQEINRLQDQISDKEALIETIDPVIADLLDRKITDSHDEFVEIMAPVIGGSIKKQVSEAKDDIADALYPVIGKTIRKSVSEAMKNLVNSINERVEQSLQKINVFNLFKSKVTGVSQGELVLRGALPCYIEELFVIQKDSGLLIAHVSGEGSESTVDEELISGMLTAIRSFVAQTFAKSPDQDLYEIQYGDYNIQLELHHNFYVAAVVKGVRPTNFTESLRKLGNRFHNRFYKKIREFSGDSSTVKDCLPMLTAFVAEFNRDYQTAVHKKSKPYFIYFAVLLLIVLLIILTVRTIIPTVKNHRHAQQITEMIQGDAFLGDENISCDLNKGQLIVSGTVTGIADQVRLDSLLRTSPQFVTIKNRVTILKSKTELTRIIDETLAPYRQNDAVDIQYIIDGDRVLLEGFVQDTQMKSDIGLLISEIDGIRTVINNLSSSRINPREKFDAFLYHHSIHFDVNETSLNREHHRTLAHIAAKMALFQSDTLFISGYSDNVSSPRYNLRLSKRRAEQVATRLVELTVPQNRIEVQYFGEAFPVAPNDTEQGRTKNRRVEFKLSKG